MADKKITDLPEIPEVADDDYLEIVDTSANTSNKISRENLIAGHDHDSDYLGISAKAADSDKLDGLDSTDFATAGHDHDSDYLGITAKAADSDKLDGNDSTAFATSTHSHDHGNLTGLTDDDHTQYVKDAGTVTDNAIVRFDGTDGRTIQNSKVTIDDNGIIKDENSNPYGRPVFLTTPLTSTSWDGDAYSTTAKTKIDLSTVFGVPAGVKAILVRLTARDSGSSAGYCQLALSPNNTAGSVAVQAYLQGVANDVYVSANGIVPCDSGGDIYYQITASGTGTLDAFIEIWGWWL